MQPRPEYYDVLVVAPRAGRNPRRELDNLSNESLVPRTRCRLKDVFRRPTLRRRVVQANRSSRWTNVAHTQSVAYGSHFRSRIRSIRSWGAMWSRYLLVVAALA
jgi:hypothetical protein